MPSDYCLRLMYYWPIYELAADEISVYKYLYT